MPPASEGETLKGLPPATEGFLAEESPKQVLNPLVRSQLFLRIGSNASLSCTPTVLHFGGFKVGSLSVQTLTVVNRGPKPVRYHLIPPTSAFFHATCLAKRGALSPGMSDTITVEFEPTEYRYFYDTIKLHVEGDENLVIPIHAYPVTNGASLPTRLDFGTCAVGEHTQRVLPLRCNVPLEFEYEIRILRPSEAIHVAPLSGVLSANGQIDLEVTFSPLRMVTEICEVELRLSEFNHKPVRCVITGSASPGVARDLALRAREDDTDMTQGTLGESRRELTVLKKGVGAGGGDGFTRRQDEVRKERVADMIASGRTRRRGGLDFSMGGHMGGNMLPRSKLQIEELDLDTASLRTQATVQKLLLRRDDRGDAGVRQRASRLSDAASTVGGDGGGGIGGPSRSLARSRSANRDAGHLLRDATFKTAMTSETSESKGALGKGMGGGGGFASAGEFEGFVTVCHPNHVDDPLVSDAVKDSVFRRLYGRVTEYIRVKEIRNIPAAGEDLMSPDEEARFQEERAALQTRADEARRLEDALRNRSVLRANAAIRKLAAPKEGGGYAAHAGRMGSPPSISPRRSSPTRGGPPPTAPEDRHPSFVIYENNDWLKRMMALERFRVVCRVVLIRVRLKRRLEKLKAVLKAAKYQFDKIDQVAREILQKGQAPKKPKKGEPQPHEFKLDPEKLRIGMVGVAWSADSGSSGAAIPLEVGNPEGFHRIDPLSLKVPLQSRLLGYSEEELDRCVDYFPPLYDQPMLQGAAEEVAVTLTVPSGEASGVDFPLLRSPPPALVRPDTHLITELKVGTRYTEDLRAYPLDISWGLDERYRLQPRAMPFVDSPGLEMDGSNGIRSLMHSSLPMLSSLPGWAPARRVVEWSHVGVLSAATAHPQVMAGTDPADDLGGGTAEDGPDELGLTVDVVPEAPRIEDLEDFLPAAVSDRFAASAAASGIPDFKMYWRRNPPPAYEELESARRLLPAEQEGREWHQALAEAKGRLLEAQRGRVERANLHIKRPGTAALQPLDDPRREDLLAEKEDIEAKLSILDEKLNKLALETFGFVPTREELEAWLSDVLDYEEQLQARAGGGGEAGPDQDDSPRSLSDQFARMERRMFGYLSSEWAEPQVSELVGRDFGVEVGPAEAGGGGGGGAGAAASQGGGFQVGMSDPGGGASRRLPRPPHRLTADTGAAAAKGNSRQAGSGRSGGGLLAAVRRFFFQSPKSGSGKR